MNSRQEKLFKNIVEQHIILAKAIGSNFLADKFNLNVSSATIRNDMVQLENQGLIYQPHTSAGRIPTQKGYKYYIKNHLKDKKISKRDKHFLNNTKKGVKIKDKELLIKNIAKCIASLTNSTAIVAFSKNNFYYTGISNLLSQPEFADFNIIYSISEVVDHIDEVMGDIFNKIKDTEIKVGKDSYFSDNCSTILTKANNKLFGIIGPIRMDYGRNLSLINYSRELIN